MENTKVTNLGLSNAIVQKLHLVSIETLKVKFSNTNFQSLHNLVFFRIYCQNQKMI